MATSQLGIGQDTAQSATGTLMQLVKDKLGDGEYSQLAAQVPGLAQITGAAADSEAGTGGLGGLGGLGGMMGKAAGMLGGEAGAAAGLVGALTSSGLSLEQAGSFAPMLFNFIKSKVDANLFNTLLQRIPEIQKLVA